MSIEIKSDKEIYLTGLPVATGGGGDTPSGGGGISVTTTLISPSAVISPANPVTQTTIEPRFVPFIQPILSSNGTMGGNSFAVSASSILHSAHEPYKAFDKDLGSNWHSSNGHPAYIQWYNPKAIGISNIEVTNRNDQGSYINEYEVLYSDDNSTWVTAVTGTSPNQTAYGKWNIQFPNYEAGYHKYWRLNCISSTGNNSNYTALAEINITAIIDTYQIQ